MVHQGGKLKQKAGCLVFFVGWGAGAEGISELVFTCLILLFMLFCSLEKGIGSMFLWSLRRLFATWVLNMINSSPLYG